MFGAIMLIAIFRSKQQQQRFLTIIKYIKTKKDWNKKSILNVKYFEWKKRIKKKTYTPWISGSLPALWMFHLNFARPFVVVISACRVYLYIYIGSLYPNSLNKLIFILTYYCFFRKSCAFFYCFCCFRLFFSFQWSFILFVAL